MSTEVKITVLPPGPRPGEFYRRMRKIEAIARAHIEGLGYIKTIAATGAGPDIIAYHRMGWMHRFEVKLAFRSAGRWITTPVYPLRKDDHFVAIVFPNSYVYVQPMPHHLQACREDGARDVTHLVREFCPEAQPPRKPKPTPGARSVCEPKKRRRRAREEIIRILQSRGESVV